MSGRFNKGIRKINWEKEFKIVFSGVTIKFCLFLDMFKGPTVSLDFKETEHQVRRPQAQEKLCAYTHPLSHSTDIGQISMPTHSMLFIKEKDFLL